MNYLFNMVTYLMGPIDRADDDGVSWRKDLRNKCEKRNFNIKFLDPTDKPIHIGQEIGEEKNRLRRLLEENKWAEAKKVVSKIRHYDLRMVDTCNFGIIYIDLNVHSCGSYDELFTAERQQKPVLVIMKQKKKDIPGWLVSFIKEEEVFESVDECVDYLGKIDSGEIIPDDRWIKLINV